MKEQRIRIERFKSISYVADKKGRVLSMRSRYASCFILTLKGKIRFDFGDKVILTDCNQGVFIPEGTTYVNECLESAESISINFYLSDRTASPCALNAINEKLAMSFYREISQKAYETGERAQYDLLSKLYSLAFLLFQTESSKSAKERLAEKAMFYMQNEFARAD